jgi:hypothetical protein
MEMSPPQEAAGCAATQELANILKNLKVDYHVHKSLPLVPILSQINRSHTTPANIYMIHFNIIQSPIPWSS